MCFPELLDEENIREQSELSFNWAIYDISGFHSNNLQSQEKAASPKYRPARCCCFAGRTSSGRYGGRKFYQNAKDNVISN